MLESQAFHQKTNVGKKRRAKEEEGRMEKVGRNVGRNEQSQDSTSQLKKQVLTQQTINLLDKKEEETEQNRRKEKDSGYANHHINTTEKAHEAKGKTTAKTVTETRDKKEQMRDARGKRSRTNDTLQAKGKCAKVASVCDGPRLSRHV